jgi:hypothetical protein
MSRARTIPFAGVCDGCGDTLPVRAFRVELLYEGGELRREQAIYCSGCEDLARMDWSGTVAGIEGPVEPAPGDRVEGSEGKLGTVRRFVRSGPGPSPACLLIVDWDGGSHVGIPFVEVEHHPTVDGVWLV